MIQPGNNLSVYLKSLLALVISIFVFTGYIYLGDKELVNFIQTHLYNPSVVNSYVRENNINAEIAQSHVLELQNRFSAALMEPVVRSSFLYNQTAEDIYERSRIFGMLLESTAGLQSVQFVDLNGLRIHFSTSSRDIIRTSSEYTAYRNYNEDVLALSYETVSVLAGSSPKTIMDEQSNRIIFSFPFNDSMEVYRGTALFYVSIKAVAERLIAEGSLNISDDISVIGDPAGILLGCPETFRADIHRNVSRLWKEGSQGRVILDTEDSGVSFSLISLRIGDDLFFGHLVNNSLFFISSSMRLILQLSIFLTFFLTFFFFLNLRPNPVTLVRNRAKCLRENLFEQLYINKTDQERVKWILELEQRRDGIRSELKRNLKINSRQETFIDSIINESWDELLGVIKSGSSQILPVIQQEEIKEIETYEEIEEVGEAEEFDDIEEVELEEIEEAEEFDDIEEVELEEIEEVEELEDIREVEEIEEVEELEDIQYVEEIEEVDKFEEVEIFNEIEEIEEIKEVEKTEEFEIIEVKPTRKGKGLLALTCEFEKKVKPTRKNKGLLALVSEMEFDKKNSAKVEEQLSESDNIKLDIVSPFSTMFSSLDDTSKK